MRDCEVHRDSFPLTSLPSLTESCKTQTANLLSLLPQRLKGSGSTFCNRKKRGKMKNIVKAGGCEGEINHWVQGFRDVNLCQCATAGAKDFVYMKQVIRKMRGTLAVFRWKFWGIPQNDGPVHPLNQNLQNQCLSKSTPMHCERFLHCIQLFSSQNFIIMKFHYFIIMKSKYIKIISLLLLFAWREGSGELLFKYE